MDGGNSVVDDEKFDDDDDDDEIDDVLFYCPYMASLVIYQQQPCGGAKYCDFVTYFKGCAVSCLLNLLLKIWGHAVISSCIVCRNFRSTNMNE